MKHLQTSALSADGTTEMMRNVLSFLAMNLIWIFFAMWLVFGMMPVLISAVLMNHMINRLEVRLLRQSLVFERAT